MSKRKDQRPVELRPRNFCYVISGNDSYVTASQFEFRMPGMDDGPGPSFTVVKIGYETTQTEAIQSLAAIVREIEANGLPCVTGSINRQDLVLLAAVDGLVDDPSELREAMPPEVLDRAERLGLVRVFQSEGAEGGDNA